MSHDSILIFVGAGAFALGFCVIGPIITHLIFGARK